MPVHQIEMSVFLVEFAGLERTPQDASPFAGADGEIPDRFFGAELRRRLFAAMEATPAAQWVRKRGLDVAVTATEPHRGRPVFRMAFSDPDAAAMFALAWIDASETDGPAAVRLASAA